MYKLKQRYVSHLKYNQTHFLLYILLLKAYVVNNIAKKTVKVLLTRGSIPCEVVVDMALNFYPVGSAPNRRGIHSFVPDLESIFCKPLLAAPLRL